MANERRTRRYDTYGSLAYQPEYQRGTAAPARRAHEPERERRPRVQPRTRTATRPQVEVRQQSAIAPFAILGFAAVALCALLLVMSSAQLAVANDEIVSLTSELAELKSEEKLLTAQYELVYDLAAIEDQLISSGEMVKASSAQTVYLDMSEGDSVTYYAAAESGLSGFIRMIEQLFGGR